MTWTVKLAVPLVCAPLILACGNAEDPAAETRRTQDARAGSRQVSLEGCVEAASGTNQYVLRHIRMAPMAEQPSDVMTAPDSGLTEGSWVKLRVGDDDQIRQHVGQRVAVTGTLSDDGRNTIGTTGPAYGPDQREPRTDASRAAGPEHHSERTAKEAGPIAQQSLVNGVAPEVAVQRITATGQKCAAQ